MDATSGIADEDLGALGERIAETVALIDATTRRLLVDILRFDRERGWERDGALSCAHWLNWRCGIVLGAAREKVRVAHALAGLPRIDDLLRLGKLSYSKVRAMTRVATAENEAALIEMARNSTASKLEKICRIFAQAKHGAGGADPPCRWLRVRNTDEGMVRIEIQLRPEEASRVVQAVDASAATRVDGIVAMAEAVLRGDRPDRPPVEVMVHVEASTLAGHDAEAGIPAETSRRLLCDAGVVPVLEDTGGTPLDVGRKTRIIPTSLRRGLIARDGSCRFPGCTNRRFVDAHHIRHWIDGGETSLANTMLLCTTHHSLVHEGKFRVVADGPELRFFSQTGEAIGAAGVPPEADGVTQTIPMPDKASDIIIDYGDSVYCDFYPEFRTAQN
jgi:hypothetical protein